MPQHTRIEEAQKSNMEHNKSLVLHEVMWCRDSCRSSKLAAMVYLVTRKKRSHTMVFMPDQEWNKAAVQALTSAGLSCGKLDGLGDDATFQRYHNGLIKVLLVTDSLLKKSQTNQVKMVVILASSGSASQYRERLEKARGGSRRPFTCVSVLPREEGASLRPVMQALKQPFTQRTVLGDVLTAIEQQVRKQEDVVNTSSGVSSEEEEDDSDDGDEQEEEEEPASLKVPAVIVEKPCGKKIHLNASIKPDSNIPSRTKATDEFFSGIESKVSAMDEVLVTSSNKSRQKKLRRKRKKQQLRTESHLNDTESDDDDDDSDDEEEEDERPRKVAQGCRQAGPMTKNRMSFTTEALTDVGVKGVKKYRNALTYQEKSLYNKTYGNSKK